MRTFALVLACSAFTGHARRVQDMQGGDGIENGAAKLTAREWELQNLAQDTKRVYEQIKTYIGQDHSSTLEQSQSGLDSLVEVGESTAQKRFTPASAFVPAAKASLPRISQPHSIRRQNTHLKEKQQWLEDAMGSSDEEKEDTATMTKLTTGLSGFCLDPELGFVAILTSTVNDDEKEQVSKYVAVTVVPATAQVDDNLLPSRLTSPQALTLVQLAGGLDLGTPILPPDALWQTIVRDGIDNDDDDYDGLVTLLGIDVLPNEDYDPAAQEQSASLVPTKADGWSQDWMEDAVRTETIEQRATQVLDAVKGFPGLQAVTLEQVADAMIYCANQEGALDRQGFSHLLDYMRRLMGLSSTTNTEAGVNWKTDSKVKFILTVNLVEQDSIKTVSVTTLDAFRAIGLAMRHKIQLQVAPECLEEDADTILEIFPAFRSIQELWEDAKIIDGFIPSMFEEAKKQ